MEQRRYEFVLEAETPIAHHAETFGNIAVVMQRKVRQKGGGFANVPCITADTMRHAMREASSYALLDAAGMLGEGAELSEGALRLLFAGGMVTGRGDGSTIKLDQYRRLAQLVPPLRLLGGCCDNRVIPGTVQVDDASLICAEQERQIPEWVREWAREAGEPLESCRSFIEEVQRVRMDPTLNPGKQTLLSEGARTLLTGRLEASEAAHAADDAIARDESKSSMMPRRFERLVQGSLFYWSVSAICYSELDVDTFHVMLGAMFRSLTVGGKRGTGHGRMRVVAGRQLQVLRPSDRADVVDATALGAAAGKLFSAHVREHAAELREYLREVNA